MTGGELAQFGSTTDQPSQVNVGGDLPPIDSETAWAYPTNIKTYNYDVDHTNIIEYDSSKNPGTVLWQFQMNPRALSAMSSVYKSAVKDHMYWSLDSMRYSLVTLNAPTTSGGAWAFYYNLNPRRVISSKTDMWKHSPSVKIAKFRDDHAGIINVAKDLYVTSPWRTTDVENDDPWRTSFGSIVMVLVGLPSDPLQSARYQLSYSFTFRVCYRQIVTPGELDMKEFYPPGPVWLDHTFGEGIMKIETAGTMASTLTITWTDGDENVNLDLDWATSNMAGNVHFPNAPEVHVTYTETISNPEGPDPEGGDDEHLARYERVNEVTQTLRHNISEARCTVSIDNGKKIEIIFTVSPPRNMAPTSATYASVERDVYPVFRYPTTTKAVRAMIPQDYNSSLIMLQSFDLSSAEYKKHFFNTALPLKYMKPKVMKNKMPTLAYMNDSFWYFAEYCNETDCECGGRSHNVFNPKPWTDAIRRMFYDKVIRSPRKLCNECNHEPCIQQQHCWAICTKCKKNDCNCSKAKK